MKDIASMGGSTSVTTVTSVTVMTSQGPRVRKFYECPKCPCRFLSENDLFYHLWTHVKPKKKKKVKPRPSRKLAIKKYREKTKAFRENYGETGLCLAKKGAVKVQYLEERPEELEEAA